MTLSNALQGIYACRDHFFKSICDLFGEEARKNPRAIAVAFENKILTYGELDRKSNQLARYLRERGVRAETFVGLSLGNSLELIVGILGILKAGGVYLPLEPSYPRDRIGYMLEDAKPSILLTESRFVDLFEGFSEEKILLDACWKEVSTFDETSLEMGIEPNHLAYVIYTSGSTGKPKGILVEHGGFAHGAMAHREFYRGILIGLLSSAISFDVSLLVIFHLLTSGGTICIPNLETTRDAEKVIDLIESNSINYLICVPSLYSMILDKSRALFSLKIVSLTGENIPHSILTLHPQLAPHAILYNEYGPTEYAIGTTIAKIYDPEEKKMHPIHVGKPLPNTRVCILDEQMQPVAQGIKGEIGIGGMGMARGYLNQSGLTEEKFIRIQSAILYRTGDFGRFLPDGNLEFLGRMDHQVKIRGNRVELGEVEQVIRQYPKVNEAVVIVREGPNGDKRLITYFTAVVKTEIGQELKAHLSQSLPNYMIPSVFMQLESFPRTPNGKIDRDALPDACNEQRNIAAPRSAFEEALAVIWKKILPVDFVGIEDNFFDLGGDSLSIAKVQTLMEAELAIKIPVAELLQYPTISQLSQHLHQEASGSIFTHPSLAVKKKAAFQRFKARAEK